MYGLIYTIPFASLDGHACVVEIEKEGYTGSSTELTPGATPFTVEVDDSDFAYEPLRLSTAKLTIVGSDYLPELFSTGYKQHRVTLLRDSAVEWCGFIKPELYTQDYSSPTFELEVECVGALSVLEHLPYTEYEAGTRSFASLWELLRRGLGATSARYTAFRMPLVYAGAASDYAGAVNMLDELSISEQNLFDEDDKAMTWQDVLAEVCRTLGWTLTDWHGAFTIVDPDHTGTYLSYPFPAMNTKSSLPTPTRCVQDVGFGGSDHSLDIVPGYNRVTVKCSNYPVETLCDSGEWSDMEPRRKFRQELESGAHYQTGYVLAAEGIILHSYKREDGTLTEDPDAPGTTPSGSGALSGQIPTDAPRQGWNYLVKCYTVDEADPDAGVDVSPEYCVRLSMPSAWSEYGVSSRVPVLEVHGAQTVYMDGAFILHLQLGIPRPAMVTPWGFLTSDDETKMTTWSFRFTLRVGDLWYSTADESWHTQQTVCTVELDDDCKADADTNFKYHDGWKDIKSNRRLMDGFNNERGLVCKTGDTTLIGSPVLTIYPPYCVFDPGHGIGATHLQAIYLKDLSFKYVKSEDITAADAGEDHSDRIYENVVNEDYVNELDEIELKMSSYNNDGACYGKLMLDGAYLTDNLWNSHTSSFMRPEELLIRRIVNRYASPSLKLTQTLKDDGSIKPFTRLTDDYLPGRRFLPLGAEIDYGMDTMSCVMLECPAAMGTEHTVVSRPIPATARSKHY